jgi:hypothetical protein
MYKKGECNGIQHNGTISMLPQPDHLIVLANDLRGTARKVKGKGGLVGTKIVDIEDEFLRKVFRIAPNGPTHARINKAVFVPRDIDANNPFEAKVPKKTWINKRCNEATASGINCVKLANN